MPADTLAPTVIAADSAAALTAALRTHRHAAVISPDPAAVPADQRAWWPLLELCSDESLAAVVAEAIAADLPGELLLYSPEAATVLGGALHAAALVGWPPVTVSHLLDAGAIATIVELLSADGDDDYALCVAGAAGDLAPGRAVVRHAAALAGRQILDAAAAITGPARAEFVGSWVWREVRGHRAPTLIVHTAGTALGRVIAERAATLAAATGTPTARGSVA